MRRVDDGTASLKPNEQYGQLNTLGVVLARKQMELWKEGDLEFLYLSDTFHLTVKMLVCAERFYRLVSFRGNVEINLVLHNVRNARLLFMPNVYVADLDQDDYRRYEGTVRATHQVAAENLNNCFVETVQTLMSQIC